MPSSDLIDRQREALRQLIQLAADRNVAETSADQARAARIQAADQEYQNQKAAIETRYTSRKEQSIADDETRRSNLLNAARERETLAKSDFSKASRRIASEFEQNRDKAKAAYQQASWEINTVYETGQRGAIDRHKEESQRLAEGGEYLEDLKLRLDDLAAAYRRLGLVSDLPAPTPDDHVKYPDPIARLYDLLRELDPKLVFVEGLAIPKLFKGANEIWLYLLGILLVGGIGLALLDTTTALVVGGIGGLVAGFGLRTWLGHVGRRQLGREIPPLKQGVADGQALAAYCREWVETNLRTRRSELTRNRDDEMNRAKKTQAQAIGQAEAKRDEDLRQTNALYTKRMTESQATQHREMQEAVKAFETLTRQIEEEYRDGTQTLEDRYRKTKEAIQSRHEAAWTKLEEDWKGGTRAVDANLRDAAAQVATVCPDWSTEGRLTWQPAADTSHAVRFGAIPLALDLIPSGLPANPRLRDGVPERYPLPALVGFPHHGNLLIEFQGDDGRQASLDMLRAMMLRLLTSQPPGKVRFTIIDPVGLGRSFGAFMHLADHDPALVNQRIWTEPEQIADRLADLSEHIEKVLQNYLRNEFETIEQYNAQAGEVAEPFRVLVVADYPVHFDDRAAARLHNIMTSGVRCGVLALVAVDKARELPDSTRLGELRNHATHFVWNRSRLVWQDPDFGQYPLQVDALPPADAVTGLLQQIGQAAKAASRVEVPFEYIAPREAAYWTGDSRAGIEIALGKAGASKRQNLSLGRGTSQHALVAGRTGSGKSTLFHALITNLALTFTPDEVELYLIDFKKGVEFKTYAEHALAHAAVVAIESEREFGISVLQRLDGVLRERAERYRLAGVQDLNGFRSVPGAPAMPRILLIVDEFQEFFIEDDKLAQEAGLLLDRLVRQGRAFGVHVVLGSQTLGGAFSLARSTLGQMAIRIALQCSESDAHLILSEENSAASMLSRPGEAVYNDANGAPDGNSFFQVCWLDDRHRDGYLDRVAEMVRTRMPGWTRRPIVFEGNVAAQIDANPFLRSRLSAAAWPETPRSASVWVGDAVAIKDPTAANFRRQGGSHLLVVGQNDEAAIGIMAASLASLAAQFAPATLDGGRLGAGLFLLDGTPEDSALAGKLLALARDLPHTRDAGTWRDTARILETVGAEVEKRQAPDAPEGPELFLLIHDIARFRDLRKREDDYGFGRRDEAPSPADRLATILRDGPIVGVHVITWCDSLNNLNRTFDRQALRELEQRVLFQMSPTDSSHLIDSPAASRLGPYRALFSCEEEGIQEKFRPYGLPEATWWRAVTAQLGRRPAAPGDNGNGRGDSDSRGPGAGARPADPASTG